MADEDLICGGADAGHTVAEKDGASAGPTQLIGSGPAGTWCSATNCSLIVHPELMFPAPRPNDASAGFKSRARNRQYQPRSPSSLRERVHQVPEVA